jgi:hypothetical protein
METIALDESKRLIHLEKIIEKGQLTFVEVGEALTEIRDKKLYRCDYKSFEDYCQEKWGWSRNRGLQMIQAAETVAELPEKVVTKVTTETAARAIRKIPQPKRAAVVEAVVESGQPVTAKTIAAAAAPLPKPPEAPVDETGHPIPEPLWEMWSQAQEARTLLSEFGRIRNTIRRAQEEKNPTYKLFNFSHVLAAMDNAYTGIKNGIPYAVCCTCQGRTSKGCRPCSETGFISEFKWGTVGREIKEIRFKGRK